jgi:hypothetical protein
MAQGRLLTGSGPAISGKQTIDRRCEVCLGAVSLGKKICSPRCRLVKWGAHALLEAWREGKAGGLGDVIQELAKVRR